MVNSKDVATEQNQLMNAQQRELYERIQAFSFDQSDAQLSFTKRLARDNGWSLLYAQQVVEEYKKFAFLAVAAGHPVTPSDQVDQAWHLHLSYTRSYWDEFCSQVLQTPLHHEPTQGGEAENQKFEDWYSKTLESYERFFGQAPPTRIWPAPKERFGRDLYFVRLNIQQNWILQKAQLRKVATMGFMIGPALILGGCYVVNPINKIDQPGAVLLVAVAVVAGYGLINFTDAIISSIRKSTGYRIGYGWSNYGDGGCGGGNGWGWGDSSSDYGDSHGGDSAGDGSGCGGGGCGGGGCGGGGCGGGG